MTDSTPDMPDQAPVDLSSLTDREREVVAVAMSGASVAAIAEALSLSEATVRSHLAHIYTKLDVAGRIELLARVNGTLAATDRGSDPRSKPVPPIRHGRPVRAALVAAAVVALALGAVALVRPDLPPPTDIGSVSTLLSQGQVASLDLRGDRLFVTRLDGQQVRVDRADRTAVEALQAVAVAHGVDVSGGGDGDANILLMVTGLLLPPGFLALVLVLAVTWFVRSRRGPTSAAAS